MRSLTRGNLKTALGSVRGSRWRSLMTMMGIIIGIVSVVTVVSIGEGVKQQVTAQINHLGKDLLTVRPGHVINHDAHGKVTGVNLFAGYTSTGSLTDSDVNDVQQTKGVKRAVPLSIVAGSLTGADKKSYPDVAVIGTTPELPSVLRQKIAYGDFFTNNDSNQNGAVIGSKVAQEVFGQDVPLGQSFDFLGQSFVVRGVFADFQTAPLSLETDFNKAVFIPYQVAQDLTSKKATIYEILAQSGPPSPATAAANITSNLKTAHGNQDDFSVLQQSDSLGVTSNILDLLTRLIAGIAAISLLVGGIGIMNVMLVSVTERMQEIGIRKAVGATSRQIMNQFLVEATVISVIGGIIGIVISLLINGVLRLLTSLTPVISWQVMALAVGVSLIVGIVFGTAPALKAARKDPIDALRNE